MWIDQPSCQRAYLLDNFFSDRLAYWMLPINLKGQGKAIENG
jgi:hypothetical protein